MKTNQQLRKSKARSKIISIRYHDKELEVVDKKRGKKDRSVFIRGKSLL